MKTTKQIDEEVIERLYNEEPSSLNDWWHYIEIRHAKLLGLISDDSVLEYVTKNIDKFKEVLGDVDIGYIVSKICNKSQSGIQEVIEERWIEDPERYNAMAHYYKKLVAKITSHLQRPAP